MAEPVSDRINDNEFPDGSIAPHGRVCAVVVAFHRSSYLPRVLSSLITQTSPPASTLIIDNGSDPETATIAQSFGATYMDPGDNLGPAGATQRAMDYFLAHFSDDDWFLRVDDDRALPDDKVIDDLVTVAEDSIRHGLKVGGIGLAGALWNARRATLTLEPIQSGVIVQPVDYLATGHFPLIRASAIRESGPMRSDLFFGMEEVEYGLRLRRHGFELLLHADRVALKRGGRDFVPKNKRLTFEVGAPSWRQYYSMRNHIVIAREYSGLLPAVFVSVTRGIVVPLVSLLFSPRNAGRLLILRLRAVFDAWTGRLGRRIDPYEWDRRHGRMGTSNELALT